MIFQSLLVSFVAFGLIAATTPQKHSPNLIWWVLGWLALVNLTTFAVRWRLGRRQSVGQSSSTEGVTE